MSQLEMFARPPKKAPSLPTAATVRPRLDAVLRQLRDGSFAEWSVADRRRWAVVFPQMCEWLPEVERAVKRAEFESFRTKLI